MRLPDKTQLRVALLIAWYDATTDDKLLEQIDGELWCLRNGISTATLEDLLPTTAVSNTDIMNQVLGNPARSRDENAAFVLCTLEEIL